MSEEDQPLAYHIVGGTLASLTLSGLAVGDCTCAPARVPRPAHVQTGFATGRVPGLLSCTTQPMEHLVGGCADIGPVF